MARYGSPSGESCYNSQLKLFSPQNGYRDKVCKTYIRFQNQSGLLRPYQPLDFPVVGVGELGDNCGMIWAKSGCLSCGHKHLDIHSCNRRECPSCWRVWASQASKRIASRLVSRRCLEKHHHKRLVHFQISLDAQNQPETYSEFRAAKRAAQKSLEELGVLGAVLIAHPYRVSNEVDADSSRAGLKSWAYVHDIAKAEGLDSSGLLERGLIRKGAHYHGIGFIGHTKSVGSGSKYVFKVIRTLNTKQGRFTMSRGRVGSEVYALANYLLSHSHSIKGMASYSWHGSLSVNSFAQEKEARAPLSCAVCGSLEVLGARAIRSMLLYGNNPGLSAAVLAEWEEAFVYGVCVREVNPGKLDGDV